MIHVVGVTPEAPSLHMATGGRAVRRVDMTGDTLQDARNSLSSAVAGDMLTTVNLGTPHYSLAQITRLTELLAGRPVTNRLRSTSTPVAMSWRRFRMWTSWRRRAWCS